MNIVNMVTAIMIGKEGRHTTLDNKIPWKAKRKTITIKFKGESAEKKGVSWVNLISSALAQENSII